MALKMRTALMAGSLAAAVLLAVPSVGVASDIMTGERTFSLNLSGNVVPFTPAIVEGESNDAVKLSSLSSNPSFQFTPADEDGRGARSVTVTARLSQDKAQAINIRKSIAKPGARTVEPVQITPTSYRLGVAKGWQSFALPKTIRNIDVPQLESLGAAPSAKENDKPSRFSPRIELDSTPQVGSTPRTFSGETSYSVEVGGSYSLSKNLDVTAGVRLRDERDRLAPLTNKQNDSQAVYVGTQIRF